jgi:hypothetical protein
MRMITSTSEPYSTGKNFDELAPPKSPKTPLGSRPSPEFGDAYQEKGSQKQSSFIMRENVADAAELSQSRKALKRGSALNAQERYNGRFICRNRNHG